MTTPSGAPAESTAASRSPRHWPNSCRPIRSCRCGPAPRPGLVDPRMSRRIVALGGARPVRDLSAARRLTPHVTAVVTVADDGGSSGRLRSELDVVPPGDLRNGVGGVGI